jgi:hypothetical protein
MKKLAKSHNLTSLYKMVQSTSAIVLKPSIQISLSCYAFGILWHINKNVQAKIQETWRKYDDQSEADLTQAQDQRDLGILHQIRDDV